MKNRKGEKNGWIGGWVGGFIWVLLLSVLLIVKGKTAAGAIGIVLFLLAVAFIVVYAPWKHPLTRYWKLMVPFYTVFFLSIVWAAGGFAQMDLHPLSVLWLLPILGCIEKKPARYTAPWIVIPLVKFRRWMLRLSLSRR